MSCVFKCTLNNSILLKNYITSIVAFTAQRHSAANAQPLIQQWLMPGTVSLTEVQPTQNGTKNL